MTFDKWEPEIEAALEGSGWVGSFAGVSPDSSTCFFDARNLTTGEMLNVKINRDTFITPEARRAEIHRQLSN